MIYGSDALQFTLPFLCVCPLDHCRPGLSLAPNGSLITQSPALRQSLTGQGSSVFQCVCLVALYCMCMQCVCVCVCAPVYCGAALFLPCVLTMCRSIDSWWPEGWLPIDPRASINMLRWLMVCVYMCVCVCVRVHDTNTVRLFQDDGMIDREGGQAQWNTSVILPT